MKVHFHVRFVNWTWYYAMYNPDYAEGKKAADLICKNVSFLLWQKQILINCGESKELRE